MDTISTKLKKMILENIKKENYCDFARIRETVVKSHLAYIHMSLSVGVAVKSEKLADEAVEAVIHIMKTKPEATEEEIVKIVVDRIMEKGL